MEKWVLLWCAITITRKNVCVGDQNVFERSLLCSPMHITYGQFDTKDWTKVCWKIKPSPD